MFCYMVVIFALIFASGNAKTLEKRSPEEGGEGIDHCTGAFGNFFAFMNWCETGEVGAKPVAAEEEVVEWSSDKNKYDVSTKEYAKDAKMLITVKNYIFSALVIHDKRYDFET